MGGTCTPEAVTQQALNFLQKLDYDFVRAKFALLFPTIGLFNKYAPQHEINYTTEEMSAMIENYVAKLKEDRVTLELKWKVQLIEMLRSRVHINQLQIAIDQGVQLKYEVPESARIAVHQAQIASWSLSKLLRNQEKLSIEALRKQAAVNDERLIVTNEQVALKEIVSRADALVLKLSQFPLPWIDGNEIEEDEFKQIMTLCPKKIPFKALKTLVLEFKALPILSKYFESVHRRLFE